MRHQVFRKHSIFAHICIITLIGLSGCASTATDPRDPMEGWNRGVQGFNDTLDDYLMKPIATGYQWVTPSFVDTGISNFYSNLQDIGVTVNDLLQWKVAQGGSDATRFLINSTLGIAGLFDVAAEFDFQKHDEDFGQTLGVWGVPKGPYIVLPFLGPSSPRGTVGLIGDGFLNPIFYVNGDVIRYSLYGLRTVDFRADLLSTTNIIDEAAIDRYEFIRNAYLQRRDYLVLDGNVVLDDDEFDDIDFDEDLE